MASGFVYVYYFESAKREAEANGRTRWPCKVGRSSDPPKRIKQQETGMMERPVLGAKIPTGHASILETFVHADLCERRVKGAPGREWFYTNPDEVHLLASAIIGPLCTTEKSVVRMIAYYRSVAGLSQAELGEAARVRQATISSLERNKGGATLDTYLKLMRVLGLGMQIGPLPYAVAMP